MALRDDFGIAVEKCGTKVAITPMTHALVLAGASNRHALMRWSQSRLRATIRLYGRPVIEYVLEALLAAKEVASITVAGAPGFVTIGGEVRRKVVWVTGGETMAQSLEQGLAAVQGEGPFLVVACDLPLLTPQAVDDFIRSARMTGGDVVYPLVPKKAVVAVARGSGKRVFRTREGAFAAGNLAWLSGRLPASVLALLQEAHRCRKRPHSLARLLDWGVATRLAARRISFSELERRVQELSRVDLRLLPVDHGCLGFDLDSPRDHLVALRCLAKRSSAFD